jgi:sRNA-binding carbon storage regulator CsrA
MHNDDGILATIKVSRVTKNQVRLSFEAEEDIKIDREERYESQIQDK